MKPYENFLASIFGGKSNKLAGVVTRSGWLGFKD
jgi:hypothetical protein